jgi:hypothetical protein
MLRMAVGHSDDVDPDDAIAAAIEGCRSGLGGLAPQATVLIAAFESFQPTMLAAVHDAFPGAAIVGATSAAEISSVAGFQEDSVSLTAFASDVADITVGFGRGLEADVEQACRTAVRQARAATAKPPKACVVLTENFVVDAQRTIDGIAAALPEGVVILGGGSARERIIETRPTLQFAGGEVADDAVAVLLFSGPLAVSTAVGTGWRTIGRRGVVTRARSGVVEAIDGRPALEFVASFIGTPGPGLAANPLAVFEDSSNDFYLRTMLPSTTAPGAVTVMGSIREGLQVQLTTATTDEILGGARASIAEAVEHFPPGVRPEAALVFSCAIRKSLLGTRTQSEAEIVRSVLGADVPVAGLYCFGEIGPIAAAGGSRILNETFVTLLLGT